MTYFSAEKKSAILKKTRATGRRETKNLLDELAAMEAGLAPSYAESAEPVGSAADPGDASELARADHVHDLTASLFASAAFSGHDGAGACTLTGAKVSDQVILLVNLTDAADGKAGFESTITVADQIQQSAASDLSAKTFAVLLLSKSGGSF